MLHPVADAPVLQEEVSADDAVFKSAGNEGAQGGPFDLHPRHAQLAEDEHPVEEHVDKEGPDGGIEGHLHETHVPQHQGEGESQAVEEVAGHYPAHIAFSGFDDALVGGIDAHDALRRDQGGQGEQGAQNERQPQHDGDALAQVFLVLHAPEAGDQHAGSHAQAHAEDLIDVDKLVGQGGGAQLRFPHAAQHDGVHHVDADGDEALEGDGDGDL